jgi:hypothetical protein
MSHYLPLETECNMPQCFRLDYHTRTLLNEPTSYQGHSPSSEANGYSVSQVSLSEAQPFNSSLDIL